MVPQRDLCDPVLRTRVQETQTKPFNKLLTGWLSVHTGSHPKQIGNSLVARRLTRAITYLNLIKRKTRTLKTKAFLP